MECTKSKYGTFGRKQQNTSTRVLGRGHSPSTTAGLAYAYAYLSQ